MFMKMQLLHGVEKTWTLKEKLIGREGWFDFSWCMKTDHRSFTSRRNYNSITSQVNEYFCGLDFVNFLLAEQNLYNQQPHCQVVSRTLARNATGYRLRKEALYAKVNHK